MALHYIIIIVAVIIIIILQVTSLIGTLKRMKFYSRIFGEKKAFEYSLVVDSNGRTNGFAVESGSNDNPYFNRINSSINNYVKNNESIDFQLLKDTVDANCDSVEEDIHTQIPIPLYLGLAGTMLGIIVGVGYLWVSGDLDSLLSVNKNAQATNNTEGIVVLLGGVAIAMI
jgi:biopolymer transport protein ExbB/TolQ